MTTNRHKYFRWTPRTAGLTIVYAVVVPTIVGGIAYAFDVSYLPDRKEHIIRGCDRSADLDRT